MPDAATPLSQLPPNPDPELRRKRAKELLQSARAGDPAALRRIRAQAARPARGAQGRDGLRLSEAQHTLARELGFASWPKLMAHVEEARPLARQAERLLAA